MIPGVLEEPALPDVKMLDKMDLPALLPLLPVHFVQLPPVVGAAGRQLANVHLHVTWDHGYLVR